MCVICDFRHSSSGVPEADAVSRKWTDEYLEANMEDRPSTVMKSGEAKPVFYFIFLFCWSEFVNLVGCCGISCGVLVRAAHTLSNVFFGCCCDRVLVRTSW